MQSIHLKAILSQIVSDFFIDLDDSTEVINDVYGSAHTF